MWSVFLPDYRSKVQGRWSDRRGLVSYGLRNTDGALIYTVFPYRQHASPPGRRKVALTPLLIW